MLANKIWLIDWLAYLKVTRHLKNYSPHEKNPKLCVAPSDSDFRGPNLQLVQLIPKSITMYSTRISKRPVVWSPWCLTDASQHYLVSIYFLVPLCVVLQEHSLFSFSTGWPVFLSSASERASGRLPIYSKTQRFVTLSSHRSISAHFKSLDLIYDCIIVAPAYVSTCSNRLDHSF